MSMSLLSARYGKHDAPNQIAVNQIIHTLLYHRSARNVSQRPDTDCAESERLSGHDRVLRGQRGVHQRDDERFKVGDTLQSAATRRTNPFEARQVGRPARGTVAPAR